MKYLQYPFKIINLSKKTFIYYQFKRLSKASNFCPTPGKYNKMSNNNDIQYFIRRIKLKAHFKAAEVLNKNNGNLFIKNSTNKQWSPKETHHTVETLIEAFNNELQKEE